MICRIERRSATTLGRSAGIVLRKTTRAAVACSCSIFSAWSATSPRLTDGEVEFELAGLDFREIEQIVDQRQEMAAAGMDVVDIAAVFVVVDFAEALQPHDFREAHDGVERRAQFVADAGEEFRFLPAGRFGRFLGLAQFRLGLLPLRDVAHHGAEGGLRFRRLQLADGEEQAAPCRPA